MSPTFWAVLTLIGYVAIGGVILFRQMRRCDEGLQFWALYVLSRLWTECVFWQRIEQQCPLPIEGGGLIVANHRSPVDPMYILSPSAFKREGYKIRVIEFMTAREYTEIRFLIGWLCRIMKSIPVERSGKDTGPAKDALRRLRSGCLVGIFPEGRLNTGEGLLPFTTGVAWLALRSGVPVYPVFIHGAPQGGTMITPFYTFCKTSISFGEPMDFSEYAGRKPTPEVLEEVTRRIRGSVAELGGVCLQDEPSEERSAPRAVAG